MTVLTSVAGDAAAEVLQYAKLAKDGAIESPQEVKMVHKRCEKKFLIVTPGIRPA